MEISDQEVNGYFRLAEKMDLRCPECGFPLAIDHETEKTICPKCNWTEN